MLTIKQFEVMALPMVTKTGLQRIDIHCHINRAAHLFLDVYRGDAALVQKVPVALNGGRSQVRVMLPVQDESFDAIWRICDREGNILAQIQAPWTRPRERTIYVMLSAHTDIGLHESQYIQRDMSVRTVDKAMQRSDETWERDVHDRYRFVMEGSWFWNNYGGDRGTEAAKAVVRDYLKQDKLGICCGLAGNHFQTFGLEEMCRSAYEKKRLKEDWDLDSETLALIDINGFPMSMIQPYSEAGVKNIIFAPNHWNPLPSAVWQMDLTKAGTYLNPDVSGGGSRVDVRYDSELPMVFYWEDKAGNRILVWASTQYGYGGASFGLFPNNRFVPETVPNMEVCMARHLPLMEEKYPYDVWLLACYDDNAEPDLEVTNSIQAWNAKWEWPKFRTLGDPGEPFRILREKYDDKIPVIRGDLAGGWYQHPITAAELLARKFEADRLLPTAEKWSSVAAILDENYEYPAVDFRRAWDHLLFNDEHSYGTSGYQGRRVYETWLQHRDWIDRAQATAQQENAAVLKAIAAKIPARSGNVAVFNPTALDRRERVELSGGRWGLVDVPAFGYRVVDEKTLASDGQVARSASQPPVIENRFYRVSFGENGAMASIIDKEQGRELLDLTNPYGANEMVYTKDNHKTFLVPEKAEFQVVTGGGQTVVTVKTRQQDLGAEMVQTITLPDHEKRIDIDNRLYHARDMFNNRRYYRYLYFAFPFAVENCRRLCHLNGAVAEYAKDATGHCTDVYMAVNEWCCAENEDHGVALMMLDSQLMEYDHIHPDKTDFGDAGEGSRMFAYVAADWLQMHLAGGSHLDYQFRYAITSYTGTYEQACVPQTAERYANPVQVVSLAEQNGTLPGDSHSFLRVDGGQRLVALKRADDGNGLIARLYGREQGASFVTGDGKVLAAERVRVDETPLAGVEVSGSGFGTYRLGGGCLQLKQRSPEQKRGENGAPAPIGSVYTGLVGEPCAARGEDAGHLYLEWGRSREEDFSHYELYRSEVSGFAPDEQSLVAKVFQEPEYVVGRYVDKGLKEHTCYYYRVCAVNDKGQRSQMSREFSAYTKESL